MVDTLLIDSHPLIVTPRQKSLADTQSPGIKQTKKTSTKQKLSIRTDSYHSDTSTESKPKSILWDDQE